MSDSVEVAKTGQLIVTIDPKVGGNMYVLILLSTRSELAVRGRGGESGPSVHSSTDWLTTPGLCRDQYFIRFTALNYVDPASQYGAKYSSFSSKVRPPHPVSPLPSPTSRY